MQVSCCTGQMMLSRIKALGSMSYMMATTGALMLPNYEWEHSYSACRTHLATSSRVNSSMPLSPSTPSLYFFTHCAANSFGSYLCRTYCWMRPVGFSVFSHASPVRVQCRQELSFIPSRPTAVLWPASLLYVLA